MSFLATRNTPAGKHKVETLLSTTLQSWTLGFNGKRGHMENYLGTSEYMRLIFVLEYFFIHYSLRFTEKYLKEMRHYVHLRDLINDYQTDYPGLATSSRAVNKVAKVVSTSSSNFVRDYFSKYMHRLL